MANECQILAELKSYNSRNTHGNVFRRNYNNSLRKMKTSCIVEQGNKDEQQTTYAFSCGKTFAHYSP